MRRILVAGMAALVAAGACLMAQTPKPKVSRGEAAAYNAMVQAQNNPDALIAAAEDLLTKYADTQFKDTALALEADAYRQKGDWEKAVIYADRSMEANPKNFQSPLTSGELLVQHTRETDLDRDDKLARAEKDLNLAIENVKAATKPNPNVTDEQWAGLQKSIVAEATSDLGLAAMTRKKYDDAIADFKTAADNDPQPAYLVRLANAYQDAGKHDEAIATCDKVLAEPNLNPRIKAIAENIKAVATRTKGPAKP
ncbi:MAG: tetratricopeptide repeat protein [Bryobacteraceae bacterium]